MLNAPLTSSRYSRRLAAMLSDLNGTVNIQSSNLHTLAVIAKREPRVGWLVGSSVAIAPTGCTYLGHG